MDDTICFAVTGTVLETIMHLSKLPILADNGTLIDGLIQSEKGD